MKIIAIEGPDRSGKTYLSKLLTRTFQLNYVKFPIIDINGLLVKYDGNDILMELESDITNICIKERHNFINSINEIKNNKLLIIDRYNLSGYVYGQLRLKTRSTMIETEKQYPFLLPDLYIIRTNTLYINIGRESNIKYDTYTSIDMQRKLYENEINILKTNINYSLKTKYELQNTSFNCLSKYLLDTDILFVKNDTSNILV